MEDYEFEDFDYEPEELLPVEDKKIEKYEENVDNFKVEKNNLNSRTVSNMVGKNSEDLIIKEKQNADEYGGFDEDFANADDIQEIEDIRYDDFVSNRNRDINQIKNKKSTENPPVQKELQPNIIIEKKQISTINKEIIPTPKKGISRDFGEIPDTNDFNNNSISAIVSSKNNNSRLVTNLNENSHLNYPKLSGIKGNNSNVISRMQVAENKYLELKTEIDNFMKDDMKVGINEFQNANANEKTKLIDTLSRENLDLIKYLDKLNQVVNLVVEASKIPVKNPNFSKKIAPHKINIQTGVTGNNKLLEVFKKECRKLENRFKQISDPSYEEKLEENLNELNSYITYYEQENKKLKNSQKQSEVQFERQFKNNIISNAELKKINMEYDNIKKLNEMVLEKVQKNKSQIADNENRINELNEWHSKLETIAREMYGIKDYENVKEEEKNEKKTQERKQNLKKKMEVLEKVATSNKKRFETEITRNEKAIVNLEKNKIELMKQLKEKTILAYKSQEKVKGIYSQYEENVILSPDIHIDDGREKELLKNDEFKYEKINSNFKNNNSIINGNMLLTDNNENINLERESIEKEKNINDNLNFSNPNGKLNNSLINNNISVINNNNISNIMDENYRKSPEMMKKEILKDLEKITSTDDSNINKNNISNITGLNLNTTDNNNNILNKNININTNLNESVKVNTTTNLVSSSTNTGNKFKPNFKFGNSINNIKIDNHESLNINSTTINLNKNKENNNEINKNEIKEEILEEKIELQDNNNSNNVNYKKIDLNIEKNVINEIKEKGSDDSQITLKKEIIDLEEDKKFNSRRKNHNNNSLNNMTNLNLVEKEPSQIQENNRSILSMNNLNNIKDEVKANNVSSITASKQKDPVPLFLQDFHNKNEEININNNTVLNNNIGNKRLKDISEKKHTSIFEDAFKDESRLNETKENRTLNERNNRSIFKLNESDDHIILDNDLNTSNTKKLNTNDRRKKEEFDNLFKDDYQEEKKNDFTSNNMLFNNNSSLINSKPNISLNGRTRDITNYSSKNNRERENKKNILDELEEIVL